MNWLTMTVYRKDFSILLRQLAGAIAVQMFLIALLPYLNRLLAEGHMPGGHEIMALKNWEWLFKLQLAVHALVGLVAAVHFSAEERLGGHDWLLRRLPVTPLRIRMEKIAAAACIIGISIVMEWLITLGIQSFGITYGENAYNTFQLLLALGIASYVVGLALSYFFDQSIIIVLLGSVILFTLVAFADRLNATPIILLSIFGILLYAIYQLSRFSYFSTTTQFRQQYDQMRVLVYCCIALFLLTFFLTFFMNFFTAYWFQANHIHPGSSQAVNFDLTVSFIFGSILTGCAVLSTLFGVYSYSSIEKDGLRCMIYHHPVSRHRLFWSKYCFGFGFALFSATCFLVCAIVYYGVNYGYPPRNIDRIVITITSVVKFVILLHIFLYTCGAFATHLNPNPLYAFLETLTVAICTFFFAFLLHYGLLWNQTDDIFFPGTGLLWIIYPLSFITLITLTLLLLLAAWRTATDRDLITANVWRRHIYLGRIWLFILAVTALIRKTDWSDLLYLFTGINL